MAITILPKASISFDDLWNTDEDTIKIDDKFQTTEDLITLSCVSYRLRNSKPSGFNYLITSDTKTLVSNITDEDREFARVLKAFFSSKILMQKLRGEKLSKFRTDLSKLLHEDFFNSYPKDLVGIAYKLPYFYEHDQLLVNEVFGSEYRDIKYAKSSKPEKTLTYIRSLDQCQKRSPAIRYWFSDELDNRVVIAVEKNNPLIPAWEILLKNPVRIGANFSVRNYDTLSFYQASPNWKIIG